MKNIKQTILFLGVFLFILVFLSLASAPLEEGTNVGFVATAPTSDPDGSSTLSIYYSAVASKFVAPVGAIRLTEIGWYSSIDSLEDNTDVGIYSHDAGNDKPDVLLSTTTFSKGAAAGWQKVAVDINVTAGTTYWIAAQVDWTDTNALIDTDSAASYKTVLRINRASLPSSWGTSTYEYADTVLAIYAVYSTTEADTTYPQFLDYNDNNASLTDTGLGLFNVTVTNTNGTVIFHINDTDILATNLTSNVYNVSFNLTSAGTYLYNWTAYGNGTSHNINTSINNYYTVNKTPDTTYPQFSNYKDDNGSLIETGIGKFNVTVENTNGTVILEINNQNITATNLTANVYNASALLTAGNYIYRWHSFGNGTDNNLNTSVNKNYQVNDSTNVTVCRNLLIANTLYTLLNNVTTTGTCINIQASNITLDCNGYAINYSSAGGYNHYGVYSNQGDTTIKNCKITEGLPSGSYDYGIYFNGAGNGIIANNNITTYGTYSFGIELIANANSNNLSNNKIKTYGIGGFGIQLLTSSNSNIILNNDIMTSGESGYSIDSDGSSLNTFSNNVLSTFGDIGYGVYMASSTNDILSNNTVTTSGTSGYGISLADSNSNIFSNNTVTTSGDMGWGIYLIASSNSNTFSGMNIKTNNTNGYAFYIGNTNQNFDISDSILNSSLVQEIYVVNVVNGGTWDFTNVTRSNGNKINISWSAGGNGTLNMFWYLDVNVTNSTGALENANVTGWDKNNLFKFSELTGTNGLIPRQTLLEYVNFNNTIITYYTNYTVNTTKTNYTTDSQSINMSTNRQLNVILASTTDLVYPIFSNYSNNNSSLLDSGIGWFNVTVTNTNGTVVLNINNTNYTATNLTSNVYNVSVSLTSGTYPYYWFSYGNGTSANYNLSSTFDYVVNATPTIIIIGRGGGSPYVPPVNTTNATDNITNITKPMNLTEEWKNETDTIKQAFNGQPNKLTWIVLGCAIFIFIFLGIKDMKQR